MGKKITWDTMKKTFPNEWLLITDFDLDQSGHIIAGIVKRHSQNKDDIYRLPALNKSTAFRFTGESSFGGLRSHAKSYNRI